MNWLKKLICGDETEKLKMDIKLLENGNSFKQGLITELNNRIKNLEEENKVLNGVKALNDKKKEKKNFLLEKY